MRTVACASHALADFRMRRAINLVQAKTSRETVFGRRTSAKRLIFLRGVKRWEKQSEGARVILSTVVGQRPGKASSSRLLQQLDKMVYFLRVASIRLSFAQLFFFGIV
jgi:hypothetical protein